MLSGRFRSYSKKEKLAEIATRCITRLQGGIYLLKLSIETLEQGVVLVSLLLPAQS